MSKEEYISISEFAKRAGVSRQAIQQRLDTSLREFVKVAQGKKVISIKGLRLFEGASLAQGFDKVCQGSKPLEESVIELLQAELEAKDRQLAAKDKQIEQLSKLLEQQQKLLDQEQQLHAATTQQLLLQEQTQQPVPAAEGQTSDVLGAPATSPETVAAAPIRTEQPKASLWERIKAARIR